MDAPPARRADDGAAREVRRRSLIAVVSTLLLGLSWLALDDLTTGREPGYFGELSVLAVTAAWFARLGSAWLRRPSR